MRVREVCTLEVVTCTPEASAAQLAGLMRERHVGAVVVVARQANGDAPVRVVTDRDLAIDVMVNGRDSFSVRASDVMSGSCASVLDTDLAYTAIWEMRRNSVRRLPVADGNGALVGIVTMDDLTRFLAQELSDTAAIAQHQLVVESSRHSR